MGFLMYDIGLLVIFAVFVFSFLYRNRKNLKKEGLLFLYKANWGIKLINYVGRRYKRTLKVLSYVSVVLGYILMASAIYLVGKIIWLYALHPAVVRAIKIPPIMPLIPYLPQVFKLSFLPPFYFIYWIVILAIIAITHEFAHGIFAAYNKVQTKTTGFGFFPFFLPVFLAAFVELNEKVMVTKKKFSQMSILSAGTFANVITGIFFFIIIWIFFSLAFSPAGVIFDDYSYSVVQISSIASINNISVENTSYENITRLIKNSSFNEIQTKEKKYVGVRGISDDKTQIALYDNAPAINAGLIGAISEIQGVRIDSLEKLSKELLKYSPGETITIRTTLENGTQDYNIILGEHPNLKGRVWLGIGFNEQKTDGFFNKVMLKLSSFRNSNLYYESASGEFGWFIYNLLWWTILISFSVAFVNMLPVGIFDGGRFFYLTVWGITKNEKVAKRAFSYMTYFFLFLLVFLMVIWARAFF